MSVAPSRARRTRSRTTPGPAFFILHSSFYLPPLSSKHRHQKGPRSDFAKLRNGDRNRMKTLSVLFTIVLFVAANSLASHLRHARALPVRTTTARLNVHRTENNQ